MQKLTGQLSENSVQIEKTENKIQLLQHQYNVLENLRQVNDALTEIKTLAEDIDKRHVQLLARKQDEARKLCNASVRNAGTETGM